MKTLRIALAQMNPVVGDLPGNRDRILALLEEALALEADLVAFPELALTGYPPEDLVLREDFVEGNLDALDEIASRTRGKDIVLVAGFVDRTEAAHNAAAVIHDGVIRDVYHKVCLPNYGVFDEMRYFEPGTRFPVYGFRGIRLGVNICEDIWHAEGPAREQAAKGGAGLIVNISASPYHVRKWQEREAMLAARAAEYGVHLVYVNCVGGQDELVFDGDSMAFDPEGKLLARAGLFEEELLVLDIEAEKIRPGGRPSSKRSSKKKASKGADPADAIPLDAAAPRERKDAIPSRVCVPGSEEDEVWRALVLATRDYVRKNGFQEVILGLSGGIDSAMVAAVAADAVGAENVRALYMPSRYSSERSRTDAFELARNLGIRIEEAPIDPVFQGFLDGLSRAFEGTPPGVAEENLQSRIRGSMLMAYSNKFGPLVLTTGNKSEYSTGYATLYGDMCGGFAVLKDVMKTMVYRLAAFRNEKAPVIPRSIIERAPTAELKPDQTDQDTLPPYPVLDAILHRYVEEDASPAEIIAEGQDAEVVHRVIRMVDASEYKRRQAPPGLKITKRAFGRDRRMPVTNLYRK